MFCELIGGLNAKLLPGNDSVFVCLLWTQFYGCLKLLSLAISRLLRELGFLSIVVKCLKVGEKANAEGLLRSLLAAASCFHRRFLSLIICRFVFLLSRSHFGSLESRGGCCAVFEELWGAYFRCCAVFEELWGAYFLDSLFGADVPNFSWCAVYKEISKEPAHSLLIRWRRL